MDVGSQMLIGGKSFSEVDWQSVGVSALEGAISGAIATATLGASLAVTAGREGLKLTGKQIAKQAGKTMLIHGTSGMVINATSQAVVKGEVNASEVILSGVIDSVTGGIGRVLPHTGLGKAVKTFGDNVAEKAKGFTRGAFDNTRLVLGNERGSVGGNVGKNASKGTGKTLNELAEQHINDSGKTVLGHFDPNGGYIRKAKNMVASYYDIGDTWNMLSKEERWTANKRFLDVIAEKGDQVYLSVPKNKIRPGSYLVDEINVLTKEKKYVWVNQWSLIKK